MSGKRLLFKSAAREKILSGATALADAVRITLGPKSKCVLTQKEWGRPVELPEEKKAAAAHESFE